MRLRVRFRWPGPPEGWSPGARVIFLLVFVVAVLLFARSLFGDKGLLEWSRLRAQERELEAEVAALREGIAEESRAILALRHGELAAERIARENLGMIRPGEVTYLLPLPERAAAPPPDTARAAEPDAGQGVDAP